MYDITCCGGNTGSTPYISYPTGAYSGIVNSNGVQYRELLSSSTGGLIREDTIANKVYIKLYSSDTAEHVLYDYNLGVHDSINFCSSDSM